MATQIISDLLSSGSYFHVFKPISYKHGAHSSLFLGMIIDKHVYWADKAEKENKVFDGWFYVQTNIIKHQTGIGEKTQRKCRNIFSELNIFSTKKKGIPARVWYKINFDALQTHLEQIIPEYKKELYVLLKEEEEELQTTTGNVRVHNGTFPGTQREMSRYNKEYQIRNSKKVSKSAKALLTSKEDNSTLVKSLRESDEEYLPIEEPAIETPIVTEVKDTDFEAITNLLGGDERELDFCTEVLESYYQSVGIDKKLTIADFEAVKNSKSLWKNTKSYIKDSLLIWNSFGDDVTNAIDPSKRWISGFVKYGLLKQLVTYVTSQLNVKKVEADSADFRRRLKIKEETGIMPAQFNQAVHDREQKAHDIDEFIIYYYNKHKEDFDEVCRSNEFEADEEMMKEAQTDVDYLEYVFKWVNHKLPSFVGKKVVESEVRKAFMSAFKSYTVTY